MSGKLEEPAEGRLQELELMVRAWAAPILARKGKGRVLLVVDLERGRITWDSYVAVEERPLDK